MSEIVEKNMVSYEYSTKDGKKVTISFEDTPEKPEFKIQGPKEFMQKVFGGLGEENETEAWLTEVQLKTEARKIYAIMEVMSAIK